MEEKCENCESYTLVKELVENNGEKEWRVFYICSVMMNELDGYGIVVDKDEHCELFEKK